MNHQRNEAAFNRMQVRPDAPAHARSSSGLAVLAASILVAVAPAFAAPKPSKPKTRPLKALIDIALSKGVERIVPSHIVSELEVDDAFLSNGRLLTKYISFNPQSTPDQKNHVFSVIYKVDQDGKMLPKGLLWDVIFGRKEGDLILADGYTINLSTDGNLKTLISITGVVRKGKHTKINPSSSEAINVQKQEFYFYTRDSIPLELDQK